MKFEPINTLGRMNYNQQKAMEEGVNLPSDLRTWFSQVCDRFLEIALADRVINPITGAMSFRSGPRLSAMIFNDELHRGS